MTAGSNRWNGAGTTYFVTGNATHPNYVSQINKNDLAMLFTMMDIAFTERVRPIAISYEYVGAGVMTRVAGWGRTGVSIFDIIYKIISVWYFFTSDSIYRL